MTTFAYKDGVLAADSAATCSGTYQGSTQKIFASKRGGLVAVSGDMAANAAFKKWVEEKHCQGEVPDTDAAYSAIWIKPNGEIYVIEFRAAVRLDAPFVAGGSGMDLATGAMAFGATAAEAVQVAAAFDTSTALPIQIARLEDLSADLPDNVIVFNAKS
jgi:hypothetical protein